MCFVALTPIYLASITMKTHFSIITDRIDQRSVCVEQNSLNHHFSLIIAIKSFSFSSYCGSRQKGDDLSVVVPSNRLNKHMTGLQRPVVK